jgi:hypothetical protein
MPLIVTSKEGAWDDLCFQVKLLENTDNAVKQNIKHENIIVNFSVPAILPMKNMKR